LDAQFRALLQEVGASIISYIPNNAYLVRATPEAADRLRQQAQAVLAYEPYYKLKSSLLSIALGDGELPPESFLKVLVFDNDRQQTTTELEQLGVEVLGAERSPFGPVLRVKASGNNLAAMARLAGVQGLERAYVRESANDLSRVAMGVAPDGVVSSNYLNLTGAGVLVNVNDTGVDAKHPDLQGRVIADTAASGVDTNGHGTHVAGIIASSGGKSLTVTNAQGSELPPVPGQFRGKAPAAKLFSMTVELESGFTVPDEYLQEQAARTNAFISNNSWNYRGDHDYDLGAASYDAAVRDALPEGVGGASCLIRLSVLATVATGTPPEPAEPGAAFCHPRRRKT
jgi:subtilisin family serine protease